MYVRLMITRNEVSRLELVIDMRVLHSEDLQGGCPC